MTPSKTLHSYLHSRLLLDSGGKARRRRLPEQIAAFACVIAVLLISELLAHAVTETAGPSQETGVSVIENPGAAVEVDGRPILFVYAAVGGFSPEERAEHIQQRIVALAKRTDIPVELIRAEDRGSWTEILAGKDLVLGVTELDATAAARPRLQLTAEYVELIRQVIKQYRLEHTWRELLRGISNTALATLALASSLLFLFWIRRFGRSRITKRFGRYETEHPTKPWARRVMGYFSRPLVTISRLFFWILILALLQTYGTVVLHFFPATRHTSYQISNWLFSQLGDFGKGLIDYLPNLILVVIICVVAYYLIEINQYIFSEIRDQKLTLRGFYPDWAEPTAKLVRVLILAGAAVVVFPYLPGSQSPAFRGISVFLGVLLSLGSSSSVAHGVAGTILTYMRAFQVGDFVRIGEHVGEVVEKTLLVTRIRTQKQEVITIPNGTVLGGVVMNYSAEARGRGVIFHTTVTIGYNAPWRTVHRLLISAALATDGVLDNPGPFVLQSALNDFYVAYELNAYTDKPLRMQFIYSELHQNIQDKFNEAGVEINSPHYAALRDGNRTTIPGNYVSEEYKTPAFAIQQEVHNTVPARENLANR
jgi:small-conductance mechanosensitive channel